MWSMQLRDEAVLLGSHGQFFWHLFSQYARLACSVVACCQGLKEETTMSPYVPDHREGIRPSIDALWGATAFAEAEFGDR
ncbi:hypothetical protein U27_03993 [Candidatus Vecturithrix granuli]|uniref:Uncharacterized protein n=1 Tax=Vecturithrix granuli TaxID=1499967 RepID=A0A081BXH4_VECG1|nr:hypothetical protein U27_03993 [Candidatus Vecturithrix granuli]